MIGQRRFATVATATACALVFSSPACAQPAAPANVCARGQALLAAGYYADAEAAFKMQLGKDPCAADGIATTKAAKTAHDAKTADERFNASVVLIRRLEKEGFESEARKQTQALVEAFPDRAIPDDIRSPDQPTGLWRRIRGKLGPPIRALVEAAIAVLAVVLVVLLAWQAVTAVVRRFLRSFRIGELAGVSADDARGQSAVLAAELGQIGASDGSHLRRLSPSEGDLQLPSALTNAYPQAGVIAALVSLLDRLLPRNLTAVSVTALPAHPTRGIGLTVETARQSGHRLNEMTLWEAEFGTVQADRPLAERIEKLMVPAAAWLVYQKEMDGKHSFLGTADWKSYAHFTVGERNQRDGETTAARRAYFRALDIDEWNVGARINLAGLLLYKQSDDETDPTWRLGIAGWLLHPEDEKATDLEDRLKLSPAGRYRWLYISTAHALLSDKIEIEKAAEWANSMMAAIDFPGNEWSGNKKLLQQARALGEQMRWPAFVLQQSVELKAGRPSSLDSVKPEWWTANVLYNMACYEARAARQTAPGAGREKHLNQARPYLHDAIDRATEPRLMRAMAKADAALENVYPDLDEKELDALTGEVSPDEQSTEAGHALGVRIREALITTLLGDGAAE